MSLLLMAKAMDIKVGNPLRKLVLLKLADNANDDGICFPSYQYIADVCEISKASARTHIEALIQMGFISKKARKNKDGSSSNLYILHLDKGMLGDGIGMPADSIGGMPGASTITSHSINQSINLPSSSEKNSDGGESKKSRFKFSDDDMTAAQWIFGLVQKLNPDVKPPSFDSWANEIRLMRERDGRTHREICELFQWANQDSFWKANVLSPAKLREKWDQLTVKKNNAKPLHKTVSELNAIEWNTEEGWRGML
ncbi:helix-turn-helix domain-containing protein [Avibacterium paragallinarum]